MNNNTTIHRLHVLKFDEPESNTKRGKNEYFNPNNNKKYEESNIHKKGDDKLNNSSRKKITENKLSSKEFRSTPKPSHDSRKTGSQFESIQTTSDNKNVNKNYNITKEINMPNSAQNSIHSDKSHLNKTKGIITIKEPPKLKSSMASTIYPNYTDPNKSADKILNYVAGRNETKGSTSKSKTGTRVQISSNKVDENANQKGRFHKRSDVKKANFKTYMRKFFRESCTPTGNNLTLSKQTCKSQATRCSEKPSSSTRKKQNKIVNVLFNRKDSDFHSRSKKNVRCRVLTSDIFGIRKNIHSVDRFIYYLHNNTKRTPNRKIRDDKYIFKTVCYPSSSKRDNLYTLQYIAEPNPISKSPQKSSPKSLQPDDERKKSNKSLLDGVKRLVNSFCSKSKEGNNIANVQALPMEAAETYIIRDCERKAFQRDLEIYGSEDRKKRSSESNGNRTPDKYIDGAGDRVDSKSFRSKQSQAKSNTTRTQYERKTYSTNRGQSRPLREDNIQYLYCKKVQREKRQPMSQFRTDQQPSGSKGIQHRNEIKPKINIKIKPGGIKIRNKDPKKIYRRCRGNKSQLSWSKIRKTFIKQDRNRSAPFIQCHPAKVCSCSPIISICKFVGYSCLACVGIVVCMPYIIMSIVFWVITYPNRYAKANFWPSFKSWVSGTKWYNILKRIINKARRPSHRCKCKKKCNCFGFQQNRQYTIGYSTTYNKVSHIEPTEDNDPIFYKGPGCFCDNIVCDCNVPTWQNMRIVKFPEDKLYMDDECLQVDNTIYDNCYCDEANKKENKVCDDEECQYQCNDQKYDTECQCNIQKNRLECQYQQCDIKPKFGEWWASGEDYEIYPYGPFGPSYSATCLEVPKSNNPCDCNMPNNEYETNEDEYDCKISENTGCGMMVGACDFEKMSSSIYVYSEKNKDEPCNKPKIITLKKSVECPGYKIDKKINGNITQKKINDECIKICKKPVEKKISVCPCKSKKTQYKVTDFPKTECQCHIEEIKNMLKQMKSVCYSYLSACRCHIEEKILKPKKSISRSYSSACQCHNKEKKKALKQEKSICRCSPSACECHNEKKKETGSVCRFYPSACQCHIKEKKKALKQERSICRCYPSACECEIEEKKETGSICRSYPSACQCHNKEKKKALKQEKSLIRCYPSVCECHNEKKKETGSVCRFYPSACQCHIKEKKKALKQERSICRCSPSACECHIEEKKETGSACQFHIKEKKKALKPKRSVCRSYPSARQYRRKEIVKMFKCPCLNRKKSVCHRSYSSRSQCKKVKKKKKFKRKMKIKVRKEKPVQIQYPTKQPCYKHPRPCKSDTMLAVRKICSQNERNQCGRGRLVTLYRDTSCQYKRKKRRKSTNKRQKLKCASSPRLQRQNLRCESSPRLQRQNLRCESSPYVQCYTQTVCSTRRVPSEVPVYIVRNRGCSPCRSKKRRSTRKKKKKVAKPKPVKPKTDKAKPVKPKPVKPKPVKPKLAKRRRSKSRKPNKMSKIFKKVRKTFDKYVEFETGMWDSGCKIENLTTPYNKTGYYFKNCFNFMRVVLFGIAACIWIPTFACVCVMCKGVFFFLG